MSGPDPKRPPRRKDTATLRLLKHYADECELCGKTDDLHLHHVLLRSRGGDDIRANIVVLDRGCHSSYHASDRLVRDRLARHLLRRRPDTLRYLDMKLGADAADEWVGNHIKGDET